VKRIVMCKYCSKKGLFEEIKFKHEEDCLMKPIKCPNSCGTTILKENLDGHKKECPEEKILCNLDCGIQVKRKEERYHSTEECIKRIAKCNYCDKQGPLDQIKSVHEEDCLLRSIECPNSCGTTILKGELDGHRKECPEEFVDCLMSHVGCQAKVIRENQKNHIEQQVMDHLMIFQEKLLSQSQEIDNLKKVIFNMQSDHQKQIAALTTELSYIKSSHKRQIQYYYPQWNIQNSPLTFSNNFQTAYNGTLHYIIGSFGPVPITSGIWEFSFSINSAQTTDAVEIGVCPLSYYDKIISSSTNRDQAVQLLRQFGYIFSVKTEIYIFSVGNKFWMRMDMIRRKLECYREEQLFAEYVDLPPGPLVPIACLAPKKYCLQITSIKVTNAD